MVGRCARRKGQRRSKRNRFGQMIDALSESPSRIVSKQEDLTVGKLDPQFRVRLAQSLRRQANKPGVPVKKKLEKRRLAASLMAINQHEARQRQ